MSPSRFKLATATISPLLKTFTVFSLVVGLSGCNENLKDCNGFWDKTFGRDACAVAQSPQTSEYQIVSATDLGVKGVLYDSEDGINLLQNMTVEKDFYLDIEESLSPPNYTITLSEPYDYVKLIEKDGKKRLAISTVGLIANKDYPFKLSIKDEKTKRQAFVEGKFYVKSATQSFSKIITTNNEVVTIGSGQNKVEVIVKQLKSPLNATFSILQQGSKKILNVYFDRDVTGEDVEILWPGAQLDDPNGVFSEPTPALLQRSKTIESTKSLKSSAIDLLDRTPYDEEGYGNNDQVEIKKGLHSYVYGLFDSFDTSEGRIVNLAKARKKMFGRGDSVEVKKAFELHTSLTTGHLQELDWSEYEPVIFVHGFNIRDNLSGGEGTWNKMPKLAMQTQIASGKTLVPFEFHWRTDANFKQVAKDLSNVIRIINKNTGKKVHIVAHSFGGILTRTMLQGLGLDGSIDVSNMVASLVTLGTPHSGIFKKDTAVDGVMKSYLVPNGQDSSSFAGCRQISCFQAGSSVTYTNQEQEFQGLTDIDKNFGSLIAQLMDTQDKLPPIPIYVGIGLTSDGGNNSTLDNGDKLISFAGQRFNIHSNTLNANEDALLNQQKIGSANVTETILGLPASARPNINKSNLTDLPTDRPFGYVHSSITGAGNLFGSDKVDGNGLEAAPNESCDTQITCTHAGYTLFRQIMGDAFNISATEYVSSEKLPPANLIINPTSSLTTQQRALLTTILTEVKAGGYISGTNILWDSVPAEKRLSYHQQLGALFEDTPRVAALKGDYSTQKQALDDFLGKYLNQANQWIVWDKTTAKHFVSLLGNMTKTAVGTLKTAYPEVTLAAGEGGKLVNASEKTQRLYHLAKALMISDKFLAVMNDCPLAVSDYKEAVQKLSAVDNGQSISVQDITTAISIPMQCMVTVFDGAGYDQPIADITALFTGTVTVGNDLKPIPITLALVDLVNIGIGLAPSNPVLERSSGILDIVSAYIDSYLLGVKIKEHTDEIVSIEQNKVVALYDKLSKALLQQRTAHLLKVRTLGYYVLDDINVVTQPDKGFVGRAVDFVVTSASNLLDKVTTVIWRFFSSVDGIINTVATAVNETASQIFDGEGEYQARAELRDASGQIVAVAANTFNINSLFNIGENTENALNDSTFENLYEVQKVGLDTSEGTLRLPLTVGNVDTTFPYIWIANSGEGTISKLDVKTGVELGRYRTGPSNTNGNPSRTTVDQEGNVWVGNRNNNTITKVGLQEFNNCVDRNGNGKIDTSTGGTDIKDWTGYFGDGQGAANAQDECILKHVVLQADGVSTPIDIRTIAIDKDNNLFVGGHQTSSVFKVNGSTGQIIKANNTNGSFYGGLVDKEGNLWAASRYFHGGVGRVLKVSGDLSTSEVIDPGIPVYGIALDKYGKIWVTDAYSTAFATFNPADVAGTKRTFNQEGRLGGLSCYAQGIAVDDNDNIFIAGSACQNDAIVGHYKQVINGDNTSIQFVANYHVSSGPTGVAVDGKGNVWSSDLSSNSVSRITLDANNPANAKVDTFPVGLTPYNYSDMTGRTVRNITNPQGTWEATFDGAIPNFEWKKVVWTLKQSLPEGTTVTAYTKVANSKIELGGKQYVEVQRDQLMTGMTGRFIKVKFRLTTNKPGVTPEITGIDLQ